MAFEQLTAAEQAALDADRANTEPVATGIPAADAGKGAGAAADGAGGASETGVPGDAAAIAAAAAAAAAAGGTEGGEATVPHAALHATREELKTVKKRAEDLEIERGQLFQKFTQLVDVLNQRQAPDPAAAAAAAKVPPADPLAALPSFEEKPAEHLLGLLKHTLNEVATLKQGNQTQQQQNDQQGRMNALASTCTALEEQFKTAEPNYEPAMAFLRTSREAELTAAGYNPLQRKAIINNESLTIGAMALQEGANPAARLYAIAQARGWKPAAAAVDPAVAAAAAAGRTVSAEERLRMAAGGRQQADSLSSVRGTGPQPMTAERLLALKPDDFLKAISSPEGRALLG